jgi:ferredoxin
MVIITFQREKCIGCNYCVDIAPERWAMSKKDGKSVLIGSREKKGFYTVKVSEAENETNTIAARNCPAKVIKILSL